MKEVKLFKRGTAQTLIPLSAPDTLILLQEKLILFVRLNEKLRNNVRNKNRFVSITQEAVEIKGQCKNRFVLCK